MERNVNSMIVIFSDGLTIKFGLLVSSHPQQESVISLDVDVPKPGCSGKSTKLVSFYVIVERRRILIISSLAWFISHEE
jgi:hypothetical protein